MWESNNNFFPQKCHISDSEHITTLPSLHTATGSTVRLRCLSWPKESSEVKEPAGRTSLTLAHEWQNDKHF